jgi:twitching motility two-component system response regulator PilG
MSTSPVSSDFRQGIASARAGHRLLARLHLAEAIDADPSNDAHWLWMAWVAESPEAAVDHLKKALERNPDNEIARAGLIWSQTMAEWDFEKALSPRATLAAVAEREARARPDSKVLPIRMPRFDELHADSSRGYGEHQKDLVSDADIDVEQLPEPESYFAQPVVEESSEEEIRHVEAHVEEYHADEAPAEHHQVEEAHDDHANPELKLTKPKTEPRPAWQLPDAQAAMRPDSIPIDQITGMYMGEGKNLVEDQFPGFNISSAVDVVNDPTASLATPFPGGTTVGKVGPNRPPSGELVTAFGSTDPNEHVDNAPSSIADSDFETITPTNMAPSLVEIPTESPLAEAPPVIEMESAAPESPSEAPVEPVDVVPHTGDGKLPKILVVDDSPTVCKIVSITLKKRGYDVGTAADGVEAMAIVASNQPDLILLDINMPRMDGYQLCKLIKGYPETKAIPVIMLSGKDGFFDRVRGKLVGCSDYITKPFDPEHLVATVERFLPAPIAASAAS